MRGEAVAQGVWVYGFLEAGSLGGFLARLPHGFRIDRLITAMVAVAGKKPHAGLTFQPAPGLAEFVEQLGAEQHIPILALLAPLDVNHHPLAGEVADFPVRS